MSAPGIAWPMQISTLRSILLSWVLAWPQFVSAGSAISIAPGADSFVFADEKGDPTKAIAVFTYLPKDVNASTAPIVFVLHGHSRTAKAYRDTWSAQADKYGFMVLAPLFDTEKWGDGQYSYTSVVGNDGAIRDSSKWSFSVIEHLFDAVKAATGNATSRYFIFGFSEGGQFVHRLVLLLPEARYAKAVVGNPGWYTMPRFDISFPYGVGGSPVTQASLKISLGRDVLVMLGDADTDPNAKDLRNTPEALAQGANRYARGQAFYKEAERRAREYKIPLAWRLQVVPGVAHEPSKMSGSAAEFLMAR
jgi:poly(3-hydroxybutyrate) depolymerase